MKTLGKKLLFRCVRVKVSKELKMLLITMTLFIGGIVLIYVTQHYKCATIEYQDLGGAHSVDVCEWVDE